MGWSSTRSAGLVAERIRPALLGSNVFNRSLSPRREGHSNSKVSIVARKYPGKRRLTRTLPEHRASVERNCERLPPRATLLRPEDTEEEAVNGRRLSDMETHEIGHGSHRPEPSLTS